MDRDRPNNVFTIPPSISFTDTLASNLIEKARKEEELLSQTLILLPTRRACRSLQEAFLRQSHGKPLLLPQMKSFGDIDADDLLIQSQNLDDFSIPPAMSAMERQIILSQIIAKLPNFAKSPAQNMALAQTLGQLLDQIYTENLSFDDLPHLVDRETFANHWQITLDFLTIISEHWPKILKERGMIDAADRRIRLLEKLNQQWQDTSPDFPVIAAGTTGSIPATAQLLKTILTLPKGQLILPGLDKNLSDQAWGQIEEGHPQATLKILLKNLDITRDQVSIWQNDNAITREKIFSHIMAPAQETQNWTKLSLTQKQKIELEDNLSKLGRYDCDTPQDEATVISLILRETLEDKNKTAALITPDRMLAKRVKETCKQWGIEIDDSAGKPLKNTTIGQYIILCAEALKDGITPLSLLSFLKHDLNTGANFKNFRSVVRKLDKDLLRGLKPAAGINSLIEHFQQRNKNNPPNKKLDLGILEFLNHIKLQIGNDADFFSNGTAPFKKLLETHLKIAESFSSIDDKKGEQTLWSGDEGEKAAEFFADLYQHTEEIGSVSGKDYIEILTQFMSGVTVRPRYGTHPRLMILGQLEARLIQTDRVILAGLNEGTWPPDPGHDPWMSRPMREKFGLPLPERSITLAAHDFVQGACAKEVFLIRSKNKDNAPTVPARWLQRLDTFLTAIDISLDIIKGQKFLDYAHHLYHVEETKPIERPAPNPPLAARPRQLSVTKIEPWLKDPYSIYASQILKLRKLDPLEKEFDVAERGTILHSIMERFIHEYPKTLPSNATDKFLEIAENTFCEIVQDQNQWRFWQPRLVRLADWIFAHESEWRQSARTLLTEAKSEITFEENLEAPFTLTARIDRIDQLNNGSIALIDYKSGGTYSQTKIESATLPQLPLEGIIVEKNGFAKDGINDKKIGALEYWKLTGGEPAGQITSVKDNSKIENALHNAEEGLINLIQEFDKQETCYLAIPNLDNAPTYNDYAHLERVKEWAALGENDTMAEAG